MTVKLFFFKLYFSLTFCYKIGMEPIAHTYRGSHLANLALSVEKIAI